MVFFFQGWIRKKKKIGLAQCTSLVLLTIALFLIRRLYRLSHQWVYRFAFSLFPHLFTMYVTSFLLILLVYLCIWQKTMLLAQCSAQLVSNAMVGGRGDKNKSGRFGALKIQALQPHCCPVGILCSYSWLLSPLIFLISYVKISPLWLPRYITVILKFH